MISSTAVKENPMRQQFMGPKTIVIYRSGVHGFGFTLRHFIVYPPDLNGSAAISNELAGILDLSQPMDTVFVKEVRPNGPAYLAGLCPGDRLLSVNGLAVAGTPYNNVVKAIQLAPTVLKLIVVPKECDILQTLFSESAHNPETNSRPRPTTQFLIDSINPRIDPLNRIHPPAELLRLPNHQNSTNSKISNDLLQRNSINESIYSEPFSNGRLNARPSPNINNQSLNDHRSHHSYADISNRTLPLIRNSLGSGGGAGGGIGNHIQQLSASTSRTIENNIDKTNATMSLSTSYGINKFRSLDRVRAVQSCDFDVNSVQSNSIELNCIIDKKSETDNNEIKCSNDTTTTTNITNTDSNLNKADTEQKHHRNDDKNTQANSATTKVVLRSKRHSVPSVDRHVRRISYLRATANDSSVHEDIKNEQTEPIEEYLRDFIDFLKRHENSTESVTNEGKMNIKVISIKGKRMSVRPWYNVAAELRGSKLKIIVLNLESETPQKLSVTFSGVLNLKEFLIGKTTYTKRNHVLKLSTNPSKSKTTNDESSSEKTELLIQIENEYDEWKVAFQKGSRRGSIDDEKPPLTITIHPECSGSGSIASPTPTPIASPNLDKEGNVSKRKWKDVVARQFRRIQGQSMSPTMQASPRLPDGASIGVPLANCPTSDKNKLIPMIMERCTEIVESRGLQVVGIYRIPGNTAAISALTEQVNKGFDEQTLNDPKWEDVNVVSSLLKLFLRRLPEALLPNNMYKHFIDADDERGQKRLIDLKILIDNLPPQSYESLKHLMKHLNLISRNCDTNLMEPKNLAIIFGPSVVRSSDGTLETVVKDMKHQCHIIEAFVSNYDYFFEGGAIPNIVEHVVQETAKTIEEKSQTELLLDNVQKVEPYRDQLDKSRFMYKLVQVARNRKAKKKYNRKTTISSMTSDTMSIGSSSTSTEYKLSETKTEASIEEDGVQSSFSVDDSSDLEDSGSMSLSTLIPTLENKIHLMRTSTYDLDESNEPIDSDGDLSSTIRRNLRIDSLQPLCLNDENIPYADESPDQIIIPSSSFKQSSNQQQQQQQNDLQQIDKNHINKIVCAPNTIDLYGKNKDIVDYGSSITNSSDDSDESNTSDLMENQTIRISRGMLREMNRILTTLERKATKLNRSLSLNIKYHNNDCCSNNVLNSCSNQSIGRLNLNNQLQSLTKEEKTDKNINKKRQIQDINKNRRTVSRPIKRRHTVGGIHYYGHTKTNYSTTNKTNDSTINKNHSNNNDNNENNNHENNRNATYSQ